MHISRDDIPMSYEFGKACKGEEVAKEEDEIWNAAHRICFHSGNWRQPFGWILGIMPLKMNGDHILWFYESLFICLLVSWIVISLRSHIALSTPPGHSTARWQCFSIIRFRWGKQNLGTRLIQHLAWKHMQISTFQANTQRITKEKTIAAPGDCYTRWWWYRRSI